MENQMLRKAVIPAAGHGTRMYPATKAFKKEFFPIVDKDGYAKPAIQLIIEEAVESGIEEVCLIVQKGGEEYFKSYFNEPISPDVWQRLSKLPWAVEQTEKLLDLGRRLHYVVQEEQKGFGHAVYCTRDWVADEPFMLMLGDHIYASYSGIRCARQLLEVFSELKKSTSAVRRTPESELHLFGTIGGIPVPDKARLYEVTELKEKPSPAYAQGHLTIEGIPSGEYLCIFGQYALTPTIFDCIQYHIDNEILEKGEIQLTNALDLMRKQEGYYAYETDGERYDIGTPEVYAKTMGSYGV